MLFKVDLAPNKVSEVPKLAESPYPMRGSNGWLAARRIHSGFLLVRTLLVELQAGNQTPLADGKAGRPYPIRDYHGWFQKDGLIRAR